MEQEEGTTGGGGRGEQGDGGHAGPTLPAEVWEEVFGWVDSVRDLCMCAATCRDWAALAWRSRTRIRLRHSKPLTNL